MCVVKWESMKCSVILITQMWSWAGWGGGLTRPPNYTPHWGSLCRSWGHIKYPFILALITRSSPKAATCLRGVGVERRSHSEETSIANQTPLSSFSLACPVGLTAPTALQLILSRSLFLQRFLFVEAKHEYKYGHSCFLSVFLYRVSCGGPQRQKQLFERLQTSAQEI